MTLPCGDLSFSEGLFEEWVCSGGQSAHENSTHLVHVEIGWDKHFPRLASLPLSLEHFRDGTAEIGRG